MDEIQLMKVGLFIRESFNRVKSGAVTCMELEAIAVESCTIVIGRRL